MRIAIAPFMQVETILQKRTGTAIDGHGEFGKLFQLFRFYVLGFLL